MHYAEYRQTDWGYISSVRTIYCVLVVCGRRAGENRDTTTSFVQLFDYMTSEVHPISVYATSTRREQELTRPRIPLPSIPDIPVGKPGSTFSRPFSLSPGFLSTQARAEGEERDEDSPEQYCPTTPRTLTLSLSTYWTVLVVVLAFVWEHLRRTEGLVLRRVKTFCLAGTAIFALKMTKKRTTVSERGGCFVSAVTFSN